MAKTKYHIVFPDGSYLMHSTSPNEYSKVELSIEELIEYKVNNLDEKFSIEELDGSKPKTTKTKIKKEPEDTEQKRSEFKKSLSPTQIVLLEKGERQIKYSKAIGYYLKVIHKEEPFFSHSNDWQDREKKIKNAIINEIQGNKKLIFTALMMRPEYLSLELQQDEFTKIFNSILYK